MIVINNTKSNLHIRPAWKIILEIENLKLEILKPITDHWKGEELKKQEKTG